MRSSIIALSFVIFFAPTASDAEEIDASPILNKIYKRLNVASFRNSTGAARTKEQKYFSDLGFLISSISNDTMLIETEVWSYKVKIVETRDINGDGLIDASICFTDKAKQGSYNVQQPILLTQYDPNGDFIAINFEVDGCENYLK